MEKHLEYREKILNFLMKTPDKYKNSGEIKNMIGLEPIKSNGWFDKALRTSKIDVKKNYISVMKDRELIGYCRVPIKTYKISNSEYNKRKKV